MRKNDTNYFQSFMMAGMLLSFIGVTFLSMIFMAKDNNYDNTVFQYFNISKGLYSRLIYLQVNKGALANGMNLCSILFILSNYAFSQINFSKANTAWNRRIRIFLSLFWAMQLAVYSTFFYKFLYSGGAGFLPDPVAFRFFYRIFHRLTAAVNLLTLVFSACCLIITALRKEAIRELRFIKWSLVVIDIGICGLYFYMYFDLPNSFLWISRSVDYTSYHSLQMPPYMAVMRILPYMVILFIIFLWINFYRYDRALRRMKDEEYVFSSIIASSEISTRAFSHYVKNELLGILSETEWMMQEPQRQKEGLEHIRQNCMEVYRRLDTLQKNANRIVLNQSRNNILQVLRETLEEYGDSFVRNHIELHYFPDTPEAYVFCDPHYIREVLVNLINNAVEAMTSQPAKKPRELTVSTVLYESEIQIKVQDTGPGIPPSMAGRLFEPFASTKPTKYNWGIGLFFSKRIINSHNGKIAAGSSPGGGAEFTLSFPLLK